jgi:hypothetical protein
LERSEPFRWVDLMSLFRPAPFGLDAVNIVTGELVIAGSTVLAGSTTFTGTGTFLLPLDVSIVLLNISTGLVSRTSLPRVNTVPVGHTITFKDSTGTLTSVGNSFIRINSLDLIDGASPATLDIAWQSATFYNNGTEWNIIKYYDGSEST